MVGWHHQLNGHEFEQTLGDTEGQGSLACYSHGVGSVGHDLATEQQYIHKCSRVVSATVVMYGCES